MTEDLLQYVKPGDATEPMRLGVPFHNGVIIAHVCNDVGAWGAGFVLPLGEKYPEARIAYKNWYRNTINENKTKFQLGEVQFVIIPPEKRIVVANMIAQCGIRWVGNIPPIRYGHLETCLKTVGKIAQENQFSVAMPKIGAGLAGGDWDTIEKLIRRCICDFYQVPVRIYIP